MSSTVTASQAAARTPARSYRRPDVVRPRQTSALVVALHAHLPYIRHPEHARFLEEEWLFEAIVEAYLPLTSVLRRIADERIPASLTLSVSPTLAAMLEDPLLQRRFEAYLEERIELAGRELFRTLWMPEWHELARWHEETFSRARRIYADELHGDLLGAWRELAEAGVIEPITTAATHAFLPYLVGSDALVRAQVELAVQSHRRIFGAAPRGFWLPECGYAPGLDRVLRASGVAYTFLESHGLEHATPRPPRGGDVPILTPAGVLALARDPAAAREVWSHQSGFPGHAEYRDFHRDAGWELELSYLEPFLHAGRRSPLGFKYHRVSGARPERSAEPARAQDLYRPAHARTQARAHAREFVGRRIERLRRDGSASVVTAPFDAELFGHWWHEGPAFLDAVLRESGSHAELPARSAGSALLEFERVTVAAPSFSSWGEGGYGATWCAPENDAVLARLAAAGARMVAAASRAVGASEEHDADRSSWEARALAQAARELLLAQASDWTFLLRAGTAASYARSRIDGHLEACTRLLRELGERRVDRERLLALETRDSIFPDLDPAVYADS